MLSAKMRKAIFQNSIPYDWQKVKKLPGVMPLNPHEWIIFDDAYSDQMAERENLLENNNDVIVLDNNSRAVARELLTILLQFLRKADDFEVSEKQVITRDKRTVKIDYEKPLMTCGLLVQNDFCLMEKRKVSLLYTKDWCGTLISRIKHGHLCSVIKSISGLYPKDVIGYLLN